MELAEAGMIWLLILNLRCTGVHELASLTHSCTPKVQDQEDLQWIWLECMEIITNKHPPITLTKPV